MPTLTGYPRRIIAVAMFAAAMTLIGLRLADLANGQLGVVTSTLAETTTLERTHVEHRTKLVTVRVKGRVIHRYDHIIVVQVARQVFHTHTTPQRRIVVPRHVVRIRQPFDGVTPLQAVIGVAPPPVTVTVPEIVTVPGPTTTVTGPTTTVTSPPITVTVPTTITVTVPLDTTGSG